MEILVFLTARIAIGRVGIPLHDVGLGDSEDCQACLAEDLIRCCTVDEAGLGRCSHEMTACLQVCQRISMPFREPLEELA
jgi:hypothetical protein